jgi:hypothetical protein
VESEAPKLLNGWRRPDTSWRITGFAAGLMIMTFGPVWAFFYAIAAPVVPLALAGVFACAGRSGRDSRLSGIAEGLLAAAVFGVISGAVVLVGGM